jgi:predicted alpha/beta-fold hydrolase
MAWYCILLIVLGSILVLLLFTIYFISLFAAKFIAHPHRFSVQECKEYNHKMKYDLGTEVLKRNPLSFTLPDGYLIHADYNLVTGSKKFVILAHGFGSSREGALRYSLIFEQLGFSTVIFDERSHGDNIHKDVTMGVKECHDLVEIIDKVYQKFGNDICLGLQGVSMGAATVLMSTRYQQ